MTQEEKAKAYDKALEVAQKELKQDLHESGVWAIKRIFPQFCESEDERIRKALIDALKVSETIGELKFRLPYPTREECIAYLEKQKEQKPNIELIQKSWYMEGYHDRKFNNESKWIIKTGEGGPRYEENPKYGQHIEEKPVECIEFDNEFENQVSHLLASVLNGEHEYNEGFVKYVAQSLLGYAKKEHKPTEWSLNQLKMFDDILVAIELDKAFSDKRVEELVELINTCRLRKYSIKPAEWNEEDEEMLNSCISSIEEAKENRYAYKETDGDTSYDHEITWLKNLSLDFKKRNEDVAKLCSNEWTEEDEVYLQDALWCVKQATKVAKSENDMGACWSAERWLKSLRPRTVQDKFNEAMHIANKFEEGYKAEVYDAKVKSWKPSKEQMKALYSALNDAISLYSNKVSPLYEEISQKHFDALESLYNDLKKLM